MATEAKTAGKADPQNRRINAVERVKAAMWMLENWQRILDTRPSKSDAARAITEECGFARPINASNVDTVLKSIERKWPFGGGRAGNGAGNHNSQAIAAMARFVVCVRTRLQAADYLSPEEWAAIEALANHADGN